MVRVEGMADMVEDAPLATELPEYVEKYRAAIARIGYDPEGFARAYSVCITITPTRLQVWQRAVRRGGAPNVVRGKAGAGL